MIRRVVRRVVLSLVPAVMLAEAGRAELIHAQPDAVLTTTAGWFCLVPPDAARPDLAGAGQVNLYSRPFDFVATGDRVASQPGIGIGIVARLGPFGRDDVLVARESHGNPCCGKEQSWQTRARPDGLIWLGYLDEPGRDMPPGEWRFSLWRGPQEVFSYRITVLPPDPDAPHLCGTPTS